MDLENIHQEYNVNFEKENENGIEIFNVTTSTQQINETLEENKENDEKSNTESIQNSIDVKPMLRLVPLEKLLAPKTTISLSPHLEQTNSKKLKNSSIIVLDDSDSDEIQKNFIKKSNENNKSRKLHKHNYNNNYNYSNDSNDELYNKVKKQSTDIKSNQYSRPTRNLLRAKTLEKIKKALASSSSEEDDDNDVTSEIDNRKKQSNKTNPKTNAEKDQPLVLQDDVSKNELDIRNSCNDILFSEKQNKDLVATIPKSSSNNKDCNGQKEPRLFVRLKRSTNETNNNKCQTANYEITSSNTEELPNHLLIDENPIKKFNNTNEKSKRNEKQNLNYGSDKRKSESSDSDELETSSKSRNNQLENNKQELNNTKGSSSKEIITEKTVEQQRVEAFDENDSFKNCKDSIVDKIETAKKQKIIHKPKLDNNVGESALLNINFKLKEFKIQLKRVSITQMKNIIKKKTNAFEFAKDKRTNLKSNDNNKIYRRRRIIHGLSSLSSEEEEEEVIKKNGKQRSNTRRESDSNDNEDDNSKDDDDDTKTKAKKPKSTTNMSSSDDDIIQQDESDIESNNSSELIRKRTVTVRMKKSTQRSDEEYILNSDEEEEDDDGSNIIKKDSDNDDDDDYESDNKKKIKRKQTSKRKRIKNASDSSDDDDEAGGSKQKRKNIRKLIKTKELNMDTKQAAQEEKDRRRRIEERQRLYNSIYEKPETTELAELVLDFDENTKKPLLKVDTGLLKLLKPHQANGVKFMWDACFETLKDAEESSGSGCILAHCMGLGKTLQVIALTHTLITHSRKTNVERVLVITPLSTLTNWAREYHYWMKSCKNKNIEIYDMSKFKDKTLRTYKLNEWFEEGGVCIMGYDMYRILSNEKTKGLRKKQRETLQQCLVDPGADIVICDEGHLLKNEKTSISKAVTKMRTKRRIVLTGTPLQNNLKEYYCMIQFIKPNLLGTYKEYLNRFVNPITNGQYTDSTERDIRLMKHRSHILHTLLEGCLQRRDYSVLAPYLPPKHEYVIYITLSEVQKTLYEFYMTRQRNHMEDMTGKGAKLFQDFQNLRRIWTHPMCLRVNSDIAIKKRLLRDDTDEEGSLKDFIDDNSASSSSDSDSVSFNSDKSIESIKNVKRIKTRNQRLNASDDSDIEEVPIVNKEDPSEWWCQMVPKEEISNINHSPKLILLMKVLDECEQIGDKLLLFSQSLQSLDVIEEFLSFINRRTQGIDIDCNINGFTGIWQPGVDYFRLDGSSSVEQRDTMCKGFNNVNNLRARLFLISTRAGSLGINLVAANRVIIFDVSWNPSHDTQSIFRVYRFGQDKPCYIYRFIAMGTMEQKVYERQVAKQAMAKRVIDEQQIGRHYNQNDLLELYTYELEPRVPRAIPILPKDRLFADLLANYEKLIYKYHEHDSLLENQENDNLSEEERKAAWDEYETEKNRPPQQQYVMYNRPTYTIGPGGYQAHHGPVTSNKIFGFRTDILLRLLNMKVGRDHPQLTPNEIVQMVPSYLQQLYSEMNHNNPTMYKELLELHQQLEMPQGYYMNPLLYSNQHQMESTRVNPYANRPPPTISTEIVEID